MFPIFIENCKYIGKDTNAMTIGPIVLCKPGIPDSTRNHEIIHHQQNIETLYVGMLVIYVYDYLKGLWNGKSSYDSYMETRAEIEAYEHEEDMEYLSKRKRYEWLFHKKPRMKLRKKM
jgi:hypothetical protein